MSVSRELLMRYHDGEVSEAEARAIEEAIEQEPALLEELEAYSEVGNFVRVWGEVHAAPQFDIAADVLRALEPPKPRVHLLPRVATWVSLGVAIAAGSVLVVRSWSAPPLAPGHAASSAEPSVSAAAQNPVAPEVSAALEDEPRPAPATIESIDFGANPGTVFVVSTDSSETPVIWLPDDADPDDDDQGRSESL